MEDQPISEVELSGKVEEGEDCLTSTSLEYNWEIACDYEPGTVAQPFI